MDRRVDVRHFVHRRSCDISSSNMAAYERWPRVSARGTKYSRLEAAPSSAVHTRGRCNDCNKLPLELNYRSLFLTYKINYGSLFYHYKKTTVIAKKLW